MVPRYIVVFLFGLQAENYLSQSTYFLVVPLWLSSRGFAIAISTHVMPDLA